MASQTNKWIVWAKIDILSCGIFTHTLIVPSKLLLMTCSYRNLWRDEKAFLSFITPRGSYFFSLNHFSPFTNSYFHTAIFSYEALHYNVKHLIFPIFSFAAKRFEKKCFHLHDGQRVLDKNEVPTKNI